MKRRFFVSFFLSLSLLVSCQVVRENASPDVAREVPPSSDAIVSESRAIVSESRAIENFNRINCSIGQLNITQGDGETLTVTAEERILPRIVSEVRDGTLYLQPKDNTALVTTEEISFNLSVQKIKELNLSGAVIVEVDRLETDQLNIDSSGTANITMDSLKANELNLDLNGSARLNFAGKVKHQRLKFSGSSEYNGAKLESQTTAIEIGGGGKATVWATHRLEAEISGVGDVSYYGNPQVIQEIRGVGAIEQLGVPPNL